MIQKKSFGTYTAKVIIWLVVILMTLSCLLPLINMIAISLSGSSAVASNQVGLLPVDFTLNTYSKLLNDGQFWTSFWISIQRVVLGTLINMFFVISMAYPLSKSKLRFPAREIYIKFVIFAMLFSGGIIPLYMVVSGLKLTDTIWALVLPGAVPVFNVILMINFFKSVPGSLDEAARIDGPVYIRIPKGPLHCIFEPGTEFGLGKGHVLSAVNGSGTCRQSAGHKRIAVISSGITTQRAAEAVKILRESGVYVTHIHMGQLKPADDDLLIETAKDHDIIVTLDNHNVIGGLGDVVCQAVSARTPAPAVIRLGIEDVFCEGMKEDQLAERHGISAAAIVRTIRHLL